MRNWVWAAVLGGAVAAGAGCGKSDPAPADDGPAAAAEDARRAKEAAATEAAERKARKARKDQD